MPSKRADTCRRCRWRLHLPGSSDSRSRRCFVTSTISRWTVPIVGFVLGILIALSMLGSDATPVEAAIAFAFVAGYAIVLRLLQSRSDVASLLSGMPRDERWESINLRALSLAAQVIAVAI